MKNLNIWPIDPKDGKPSVSLGILMISTACMIIAIGLSLAGKAQSTSLVTEWWFGSAALYFGRRMSIKDKVIESVSSSEGLK